MVRTIKLEQELLKVAEARPSEEPATLAQAVSNELMIGMPRISHEMFEGKREATILLTEGEIESIKTYFMKKLSGRDDERISNGQEEIDKKLKVRCCSVLPRFLYVNINEEEVKLSSASVYVRGSLSFKMENFGQNSIFTLRGKNGPGIGLRFGCGQKEKNDIKIEFNWKAPFRPEVYTGVPKIPDGFRELGDDAIAEYFYAVRNAPIGLRKTTKYIQPTLGVLWGPEDSLLRAEVKIPRIRQALRLQSPEPRGDPALILDIPDGDKSYKHVVAVWDIGDELPLRNWLAEYTEGGR